MPRYRIDAVVSRPSDIDSDEAMGELVERALEHAFDVHDLSVYEVCHLPSYAEQAREKKNR